MRLLLHRLLVCGACLCLLGAAPRAARPRRAVTAATRTQAKSFFNAGVRAYKAGQFLAAAQAFTEAHKLLAKPELLFSIAQAYRRQFHVGHEPAHLRQAIERYRAYLEQVKTGGRRLETAQALSELAPFATALGLEGRAAEAAAFRTRLMVSTAVRGAVVTVDGGPVRAAPLSVEVKPGRHRVLVRAAGYAPDERNVMAIEHGLVALDVVLRPLPATLVIVGEDGAALYVDGERRAELPTHEPVALPAGRHLVAVVRRGHRPFERALDFRRGTRTRIALDLPSTPQRYAAFGAFGLSAAGAGVTVVLAVLAAGSKQQADDIRALQEAGPITEAQRLEHNDAVARRDDLLWATAVSGAATGLAALTALGLWVFDMPTPRHPLSSEPSEAPVEPGPLEPVELAASPWLLPGAFGLGARLRFW